MAGQCSDGPYCGIAHLTLSYGLKRYVGTGFLFRREAIGKELFVILTAGHNLYDVAEQRLADEVVIRFGRSGEIIKRTQDFRVPAKFTQGCKDFDFGMILLDASDPIPREHASQPMLNVKSDNILANVFMSGRPSGGKEGGTQWQLDVNSKKTTDDTLLYKVRDENSGSPVYWKIPDLNQYLALGIYVTEGDTKGYNTATRITMETMTDYIDKWLDFKDDDWVYYPWVDSPHKDVDDCEFRKTWGKDLSTEQLASRAEQLGCPAFNTGGAIKTEVKPKAEWVNLFSYDSGVDGSGPYGMWVKWECAKQMR